MSDIKQRARDVVEAFPSYAFDRAHTETLAKEVEVALVAEREAARPVIEAARQIEYELFTRGRGRIGPETYKRLHDANAAYAAAHPQDRAAPGETEAG